MTFDLPFACSPLANSSLPARHEDHRRPQRAPSNLTPPTGVPSLSLVVTEDPLDVLEATPSSSRRVRHRRHRLWSPSFHRLLRARRGNLPFAVRGIGAWRPREGAPGVARDYSS